MHAFTFLAKQGARQDRFYTLISFTSLSGNKQATYIKELSINLLLLLWGLVAG